MSKWIKWWKDKDIVKIVIIALTTVAVCYGISCIGDNAICILGIVASAIVGGKMIGKIITKKIGDLEL